MEAPGPEELSRHTAFVRAIVRRLLLDEHQAEDVVQDSMLAALRRPPTRGNLRGWLAGVAKNLARMARRSDARRERRERAAARPEGLPSTAEAVERLEAQRRVVDAVLALEEPYRTTMIQRYLYELPPSEIATKLGVPLETVRTRLRRGLQRLRARLGGALLLLLLRPEPARAALIGVAVMSAKAKIGIAAVILLAIALSFSLAVQPPATESPEHADSARATATVADPAGGQRDGDASPAAWPGVDRDRDLHGTVVDRAGRPVAGARLRAVAYPWRRTNALYLGWEAEDGPDTVSDGDGRFSLRLARGALVGLRVSREGFAPLELAKLQAGERVRVVLSPGVGLEVSLGTPGVPVQVTRARHHGDLSVRREGNTEADGRVLFEKLPAGAVVAVGLSDPRLPMVRGKVVPLPESGIHRLELDVPPGRMIRGRVLDAETGQPIEGAQVGLSWTVRTYTTTDAGGRYEINAWGGRDTIMDISARAQGYATFLRRVGDAATYEFRLAKETQATGRLLDPAGRPIAGALVAAIGTHRLQVSHGHGTTASNGRFRIRGLGAGLHSLILLAPGFARSIFEFEPDDGETNLGDITLAPGHAIEGRILTADGRPSPRTSILLAGANRDRDRLLGRPLRDPPPYGTEESRFSDDLGRFRFADLAPGEYTLKVERPGAVDVEQTVELEERDLTGLALRLPAARRFTVIVTDVFDHPVPRTMVTLSHEGGGGKAITGADGMAVFFVTGRVRRIRPYPPLPTGLPRPDYLQAQPIDDLPADATEARFRLEIGGEIAGTVVGTSGRPLPNVDLAVLRDGKEVATAMSRDGGRFRVEVPARGTVDLVVTGRQAKVQRRGRTIRTTDPALSGALRGVSAGARDLRLVARPPDLALVVRVEAPDGSPVENARAEAEQSKATTGSDGVARLTGLPDRAVTVHVHPMVGSPFPAPRPARVVPTGQELVMRAEAGVQVSGSARLGDGSAVAGAIVAARGRDRGTDYVICHALADAQGRFTLHLPKGGAPFVWAHDGKNVGFAQDVRPGRTLELTLKPRPR